MEQDKLQPQRFELKYLVNEDVALAMRDFIRCYLIPDEFAAQSEIFSYPNHSLYLDSDDLRIYWDVVNGNKNRYKLRLRYYDDNPKAPVFFEIKRRSDNAILKERGAVRRDAVATLLAGQLPDASHLVSNHPRHLTALQHFCRLMHDSAAKPRTHVRYLREAWMSAADNSVRVTFDREVCSTAHTEPVVTTFMENPVMPWGRLVILELKFTTRFPNWFFEMVRLYNAMQCGVAKYAEGVAMIGEEQLNPLFHQPEHSDRVEKFLREHRNPRGEGSKSEGEKKQSGMDNLLSAFFSADYSAQPINVSALLLGLCLAFLGGMAIASTYMVTHRGLSYSRAFVNALVIIPMVVTVVMMVLNNNLVTAFGLMAVFAVVRFRNVLRDTLDTSYVLCVLVVGMACGTQRFSLAVIATATLIAVMFFLWYTAFGSRHRYDVIVNLHWTRPITELGFMSRVLQRHSRTMHCASQRSSDMDAGTDLSYRLLLRNPDRTDDLLNELREVTGVSRVTSLKAQEESEL